MQENHKEITGVLHQKASEKHYKLRRYEPEIELSCLIEQFWFVDWQISDHKSHTQKNLPDPNFHLVIEAQQVQLIGPVSKVFSYRMSEQGRVIGVKFTVASLMHLLEKPPSYYVDKALPVSNIFGAEAEHLLLPLYTCQSDEVLVDLLSSFLKSYNVPMSLHQRQALKLCSLIKNDPSIYTVEALAAKSNWSKRTIQRIFNKYVGLTPKWLIRKFRLHQVLRQLEHGNLDMLDIVNLLEYTDQAHLIRDFKEVIGITPGQYLK
ncbi:hypothetical protein N473_24970 [Pseudoalteromonas luteoviolacea CPMOR-1]|uniref:HTH araC/xylS-type domain-containing protein n=1 Tax=Pseudoalteromonas luteoviolacea CPMOR-1 TaxID=1365248 RepID=A0A167IYB3_9GAMM|nr:helix-turn-helix transcriptional regulator [Pseudoalteromonas luteoviolacea]KZN60236.1 hypothetical protein N473_24970 [Pseudoalteromonas luteoviolacea CPMOR-1]